MVVCVSSSSVSSVGTSAGSAAVGVTSGAIVGVGEAALCWRTGVPWMRLTPREISMPATKTISIHFCVTRILCPPSLRSTVRGTTITSTMAMTRFHRLPMPVALSSPNGRGTIRKSTARAPSTMPKIICARRNCLSSILATNA